MLKIHFFTCRLVLALIISGCSIEVNQTPVSISPTANTQSVNATLAPNATKVPITWGSLNLTGKLVYVAASSTTPVVNILSLDLATGGLVTLFQTPRGGWTDAAAVSQDHETLILAYSPPMDVIYGGQESLYTMPMSGSGPPELLIIPPTDGDEFSQPTWSPDGKYIYLAHINSQSTATYEIMRMAYPDGSLEKLIDHAYWPRLSDDGTRLVYVSLDPQSGANSLFIANTDGTDAHQVPINGLPVPSVIDSPMFSPDNQSIIFSSPIGLNASVPNLMDKLLGVIIAYADGTLPSDWWSVSVSGGTAIQLTDVQSLGLFGVFSPDKKHIASYSSYGIFVSATKRIFL